MDVFDFGVRFPLYPDVGHRDEIRMPNEHRTGRVRAGLHRA